MTSLADVRSNTDAFVLILSSFLGRVMYHTFCALTSLAEARSSTDVIVFCRTYFAALARRQAAWFASHTVHCRSTVGFR